MPHRSRPLSARSKPSSPRRASGSQHTASRQCGRRQAGRESERREKSSGPLKRPASQGREEVDLTVLPDMLQQPELRGLAIYHDGETGHDEVLFCIVEFHLQAREHLIKVVNHLADRLTRHVHLLLPPRQALHKGRDPYFWHDALPTIRTVGPILEVWIPPLLQRLTGGQ